MKIAFVDYDLTHSSKKILCPEIMKLGTYYRSKGIDVGVYSGNVSINKFDRIILVSHYCGKAMVNNYLEHPNSAAFGTAFNNMEYIPLEPNEIEFLDTDTALYNDFLRRRYLNKTYTEKEIIKMKETTWERLYPTEKHISLKKLLTGKRVCLSDNYIFDREDLFPTLIQLSIYSSYIHFINSQIIKNTDDLIKFKKMVQYDFKGLKGLIAIDNIDEFKNFILENKDIIRSINNKIRFLGAYDKINSYNSEFFKKDIELCFQKYDFAVENNIRPIFECYNFSKKINIPFFYFAFTSWSQNTIGRQTFYEAAIKMSKRYPEHLSVLESMITTNPIYYYWFNKDFKIRR